MSNCLLDSYFNVRVWNDTTSSLTINETSFLDLQLKSESNNFHFFALTDHTIPQSLCLTIIIIVLRSLHLNSSNMVRLQMSLNQTGFLCSVYDD